MIHSTNPNTADLPPLRLDIDGDEYFAQFARVLLHYASTERRDAESRHAWLLLQSYHRPASSPGNQFHPTDRMVGEALEGMLLDLVGRHEAPSLAHACGMLLELIALETTNAACADIE